MNTDRPKNQSQEPTPPDDASDLENADDAAIGGAVADSDEEPELDFDTEN